MSSQVPADVVIVLEAMATILRILLITVVDAAQLIPTRNPKGEGIDTGPAAAGAGVVPERSPRQRRLLALRASPPTKLPRDENAKRQKRRRGSVSLADTVSINNLG